MLNAFTKPNSLTQEADSSPFQPAETPNSLDVSLSPNPDRLVFVDTGIGNVDALTETLQSEQIVFIDSAEDGIQKITEVLSTQQDLSAVHIFSHGSAGAINLGNSRLAHDNLDSYSNELATWGTALLGEGDLFFYGCDVAKGDMGQGFVGAIAHFTQADVAASTDTTGHKSLGGNWQLEVSTGEVSTAFALEAYEGILPTYQGNTYQLTSAGSWEEALAEAQSLGGSLVAINDAAEESWIDSTFGTGESFWLGLSDRNTEGSFLWENGDTSGYRNWAPGEPNDYRVGAAFANGEDYTLKNWGGTNRWNDTPNILWGNRYRGIVEIAGSTDGGGGDNGGGDNGGNNGGGQNTSSSAQRIEAETAQLTGVASTNTNHTGFSGSGFVDKFTIKGAAVTFTVNAEAAGAYNTTLRYSPGPNGPSNNGTKALSIYVNGTDIKDTNLASTGTWKTWKNKTEVLNLKAGNNTITYQHNNDDNGIVNLDYIWTSKAVGNGPLETPINDFGLGLEVKKITQLPTDSTGSPARMIGMTTQGPRTYAYEERDGHIYDISGRTSSNRTPNLLFDVGAAVKASTGRNLNTTNVTHGG
mgnify:CR=1 FL=1